ncbi:MAG: hypothetical protein DA443_00700 [Bacteroidetes bacterium]|nr:MAG: hypothetical protein DA443_00700 [Bacteroidota bacterium]
MAVAGYLSCHMKGGECSLLELPRAKWWVQGTGHKMAELPGNWIAESDKIKDHEQLKSDISS